ncbi:wall-associated kinase 2 [Prunus dulcis]|uniref:Wall-associated kinase 2 n=1 Tax=Prunus dulcis TaxID=3755 RepID=A0A5H2XPY3_PRUDU|nr:wall-associated kinase 2 [Prunus dulcis]
MFPLHSVNPTLVHSSSSEPTLQPTQSIPPPRQPLRPKHSPAWHNDYHMSNQVNHSASKPHSSANIIGLTEPTSYAQAIHDPNWQHAMHAELKALQQNNTYSMVPLPVGHKPIGCKWVYKIKYKSDGTIERYKAWLVAKGYTQVEGIDYQETFSPTTKLTTLRCLITVAAARNWFIHQLDVQNAFLNGDLHEVVYMELPPGLRRQGENICTKAGYQQSKADYSLFTKAEDNSFTVVLIYLDDILITGNDLQEMERLKKFLIQRFCIKDLGDLKYFLVIEFSRSKKDSGLKGARLDKFPMEQNLKLTPTDGAFLNDPTKYRRLVGRLIYLTITRPDIVYSVRTLSEFVHQPRKPHWDAALQILKYIKGTPGQGLFFPASNNLALKAFSDSNWGGCRATKSLDQIPPKVDHEFLALEIEC